MKECPHLLDRKSPKEIRVFQVTDDPRGTSLVYPDEPSFLSHHRLVLHGPQGSPLLCDFTEQGSLRPLFEDGVSRGVRMAPDGRSLLAIEHNRNGNGNLTLRRMDAESLKMETVFQADGSLPGTPIKVGQFSVMSVSSDGRRVGGAAWLGNGTQVDAPFGVIVLDLEKGVAKVVAEDPNFNNTHLQYCRSTDPEASHDLMVQMNHGSHSDLTGKVTCALGPPSDGGADVHVIRDDGTLWRDLPWGRDGQESCIGHQVWRGKGTSAVTVTLQNPDTSYGWGDNTRQEVVAGWPIKADRNQHRGRQHRGARRVLLSKGFRQPRFCHLCTDASGLKFVFDTFPIFDEVRAGMRIYVGSTPDENTPLKFKYLLNTGVTFNAANGYHAHPILSPDGTHLLFNSNISGIRQVYCVTGFEMYL